MQYPWLFASFMPSLVADHLGVKGVVVSGDGIADTKIKAFEKQPRGALGTFTRVNGKNTWLRERNELLKNFALDGKPRILICEKGTCREEGLVSLPDAASPSVEKPSSLSRAGSDEKTTSAKKITTANEKSSLGETTSSANIPTPVVASVSDSTPAALPKPEPLEFQKVPIESKTVVAAPLVVQDSSRSVGEGVEAKEVVIPAPAPLVGQENVER